MLIGERYFYGEENIIVKAMSDSFESDPDVFISLVNRFPSSSRTAEWVCMRDSTDTCIVHNGQF